MASWGWGQGGKWLGVWRTFWLGARSLAVLCVYRFRNVFNAKVLEKTKEAKEKRKEELLELKRRLVRDE